jgi:hypothetical protein
MGRRSELFEIALVALAVAISAVALLVTVTVAYAAGYAAGKGELPISPARGLFPPKMDRAAKAELERQSELARAIDEYTGE